ncbi:MULTISPECIES: hypothetical protein [Hyphomonas]|mgnify:FL=1|uniref:Uncharacterized protein n=2 Tax=Hyphomonas atlantica TaxID=1280948 RepID=A0A059ECI6_9PROT|nr:MULTISPECIES: hypothetical protein [Hyphomonas]KCZ65386.1 hypothetical protein HY36_03070 [Hyphomonas atlantica]|tara:strand:- start:4468 stop:5088 length:621 start_codon:yes stop_codon:yes gene_type:complete
MSPQSLTDDLAYVRDLAEAGQKAPLLGGRFLAWWGGLTTFAYLGHYAISTGMFGLQPVAFAALWVGYIVIGMGGMFLMQMRFSGHKPGAASVGNQVSRIVWQASGCFLGAYFTGAFLAALLGQGTGAFMWSVPMVIGLYGLAQFVSGEMAQNRVLSISGTAAIASTVPAVLLMNTPYIVLLGSAVAAISVFLPGILLMRNEPSETV